MTEHQLQRMLDCYPARHWWQDADRLIAKAEGRE